MPSSQSTYLNIPCPKCQEADCFWHCQKCFMRLRCKDRTIFCSCSQGDILDFEFCCIQKSHDNEFYPYKTNKVYAALERLTLTKSVNILLLGSTGVGKTTLINSIPNYLKFETLEEAEINPLSLLVPTSFQIQDQHYEEIDVKMGNENEFESFEKGKSATRCPKVHTIAYNNVVINFIDTPGLCDTSGINKDKENLNQILNYICSFPELHGIYNEAFRYLCAKKNGISYDQDEYSYCQNAWERSRNETFRLINHVLSNSPHLTNQTAVLNAVRCIIIGLNKPLATITTQIQKNKNLLETHRIEIGNLTGKEKDFRTRIKISQICIKKVPLDRRRVVCNKCAKPKRDDHQNDYKVYPKKCQCPMGHHEHINYKYVENKNFIEDEEIKKELLTVTSKIEAKKRVIKWIGTLIKEYDNEQKLVNRCAAVFSSYLKSNSIILNNKSHEEYLNIELENAKLTGKIADIQNLENALTAYSEEKEILEKQLGQLNTNVSSKELTAADIFAARNKLFNLKWSGSTLRDIFDRELTNPVFHHVNSIQQQITKQKQQCKEDKPSWRKRTQEICATVIAGMTDFTSTNYREPPRIDDYGRALYKGSLNSSPYEY
uniref:G domain-containing protein n=1 Tax=Panagrolaimus superbus TaxID=310955 RepID=A0A914YXI0_9BILA